MTRWVLVADNSCAKVMSYQRTRLDTLEEIEHPEGRLYNHDINSDGLGRTDRGGGRAGSSDYQPLQSAKQRISEQYAQQLCRHLDNARRAGEFDELYVCAPPTLLGQLRAKMPRNLSQCVRQEIAKDLVNADEKQLLTQLNPRTTLG